MAQLSTKIKLYANQEVDFTTDVKLQDDSDGNGAYIKEWNLAIAEPTDAQLANYESAGNAQELLKANLAKRIYPSIGDQLDMLWHSIDNDAELKSKYFDFHQAILAVKAKHPK